MTRPQTPSQAKSAGVKPEDYTISWRDYCAHLIDIEKDKDGIKLVMKLDDEGNHALVMNKEEAKIFSNHIFSKVADMHRRRA